MDEEQNRVNQRPLINSLRALVDSHDRICSRSGLCDRKGEEEVFRPTNDRSFQSPREIEKTSATKVKEREATVKDMIEQMYRKPRNGTLVVPKTWAAAIDMHGGMRVLKDNNNNTTIKADGRTVETLS